MRNISIQVGTPIVASSIDPKRIRGEIGRQIQVSEDYEDLTNKPSINSVTLQGDMTANDLGLAAADAVVTSFNGQTGEVTYTAPVLSVNGQTGAVTLSIPTVPTDISAFNNDAGYITAAGAPVQSVNGQTGDVSLTIPTVPTDISAFNNDAGYITSVEAPVQSVNGMTGTVTGLQPAGDYAAAAAGDTTKTAVKTAAIPYAQVDDTSTSTVFTATVPGITEYKHGVCCMLRNGVVTSASGFTVNINGLGAKRVYNSMAEATADTTLFNINYTMLFVYDENRIEGGCWVMYRGYNSDTNTIGYQIRTNSSTMPAADKTYRYRLLFTTADGQKLMPANKSTSTNATAVRTPNDRAFDPHGPILYYNYTTAIEAGANFGTSYLLEQMSLALGYSFNSTGAALNMPFPKPIYIKATPQADGSAVLDSSEPYVFALPTTADGKIYIYLGRTYSATNIEMMLQHPVYHYYNGAIRLWTGPV